jgi:hypothetical protein
LTEQDSANSYAEESGSAGPLNNAVAFSADGTGLFVRSSIIGFGEDDGWIQRFSFDPLTAEISDDPEFTSDAEYSNSYGSSTIGVNPAGERIYLTAGDHIQIIDGTTGADLGSVTHPEMTSMRSIDVIQ